VTGTEIDLVLLEYLDQVQNGYPGHSLTSRARYLLQSSR
jgi:hypothetical protein